MDLNLKGRVAVVTGAGAGIGEAIAGALASEGCSVWLADRDRAAATSAAAALSFHGHAATALVVDVADAAAVFAAFAQVEKTAGRLDILVNAAGLISTGAFADLPASEWDRVARVNVAGILNCVKAAMPAARSEEHTSELQSHHDLVCRLLLEKKKNNDHTDGNHHTRIPRPRGAAPHS